ncbi:MAG: aspartate-semialdehyde dehydrogenase [Planctomycetota bacterium]|nr:aspartate-semialdehyde dehydrogenase [Planctomycetota bacterium]
MSERVAIVGATGAVGREFLTVLEKRDFPLRDLRLLASARSAGRRLTFRGEELTVETLGDKSLDGIGIAFFSAGSVVARDQSRRAGASTLIIDNSSAFRMDDQVPLIVPEVNGEEAVRHQGIISNPNCSTILFVVAIHPIHIIARIRRAIVCTYQAVSGAGARGVESLTRESRNPGKRDPESVFPHPIADNLIPEVGGVNESGDTEEEVKMERETRKILADPDMRVSSTCVRVPVSRAHSEAIHLELERPLSRAEAREAMEKAKGVELLDDPSSHLYPTPQRASGQDKVLVGRIRESEVLKNGLVCFISGDQLLKGAALNAVQIAELLL